MVLDFSLAFILLRRTSKTSKLYGFCFHPDNLLSEHCQISGRCDVELQKEGMRRANPIACSHLVCLVDTCLALLHYFSRTGKHC